MKPEQNGFRKNHSMTLASYTLMKTVTESLNRKSSVVSIFLDMSKALDFEDHKLLLYKLEKYGILGTALDWLKRYLENRCQCVEIQST